MSERYEIEVHMTHEWMPYPGHYPTADKARETAAQIYGGTVETRVVRIDRTVIN